MSSGDQVCKQFQTLLYCFGVYHWRERLRRIVVSTLLFAASVVTFRRGRRWLRLAAVAVAGGALYRGADAARRLVSPAPWALDRAKYDGLASILPLDDVDRALDVGCGSGRSLVGLAPHLPDGCDVIGLDVFDDRVILGNGPQLAKRNGSRAGIDVSPVAGDASRLPFADGSFGLVTACRVAHDIPEDRRAAAFDELRRVCADDGTVGLLELPITPDGVGDYEAYWRRCLADAGLEVERVTTIERTRRPGEPYVAIAATPE
ncbi:class I SAM-dependent methyltransferase [Haloplanus aerogenes]|uniref:Class I SAM-dependent methyltransferase n=1 Tax=Haloplanus aerogenes TaxID=660522 RepID=A0A3M0DNW9_9EURY|nr:class I SAM-dependent methyltransferase [Haloplanus aerogenes]AZH24738.1 class I SAM-dependent methyltransferase [Haloplanus aerogenes]RMB23601.1 methyltransferase family protein [Haloplanus aerogenes]